MDSLDGITKDWVDMLLTDERVEADLDVLRKQGAIGRAWALHRHITALTALLAESQQREKAADEYPHQSDNNRLSNALQEAEKRGRIDGLKEALTLIFDWRTPDREKIRNRIAALDRVPDTK